jgi:hypothetical protein
MIIEACSDVGSLLCLRRASTFTDLLTATPRPTESSQDHNLLCVRYYSYSFKDALGVLEGAMPCILLLVSDISTPYMLHLQMHSRLSYQKHTAWSECIQYNRTCPWNLRQSILREQSVLIYLLMMKNGNIYPPVLEFRQTTSLTNGLLFVSD